MANMTNWQETLTRWVKECQFISPDFKTLDESDLEAFFVKFMEELNKRKQVYEPLTLLELLNSNFPAFVPQMNFHVGVNKMCSSENTFIFSLLLQYSCVQCANPFFQSKCRNLDLGAQNRIASFCQQIVELKGPLNRTALNNIIVFVSNMDPTYINYGPNTDTVKHSAGNRAGSDVGIPDSTFISPRPSYSGLGCVTPIRQSLRSSPCTPKTALLESNQKEIYELRAQLDTEKYDKTMLDATIKHQEDEILRQETKIKQLKKSIKELQEKLQLQSDIEAEVTSSNQQTNMLEKQLRIEIQRLNTLNNTTAQELDEATDAKLALEKKLKDTSENLHICLTRVSCLEQQIVALTEDVMTKDRALDYCKNANIELEQFIYELRRSKRADLNDSSDCLDNSVNHSSSLESSSPENLASEVIDKQLREKQKENEELKRAINECNAKHSKWAQQLETIVAKQIKQLCSSDSNLDCLELKPDEESVDGSMKVVEVFLNKLGNEHNRQVNEMAKLEQKVKVLTKNAAKYKELFEALLKETKLHFKVLKNAGLVDSNRADIRTDNIEEIRDYFQCIKQKSLQKFTVIADLKDSINYKDSVIKRLNKDRFELDAERTKIKNQIDASRLEAIEATRKLNDFIKKSESVEKGKEAGLGERNMRSNSNFRFLEKRYKNQVSEFEGKVANLQDRLAEAEELNTKLKKLSDQQQKELEKMNQKQKQFDVKEIENKEQELQLKDIENKYFQALKDLDEKQATISSNETKIKKIIDDKNEEIKKLNVELNSMSHKNISLQVKVSDLEKEIKNIKFELMLWEDTENSKFANNSSLKKNDISLTKISNQLTCEIKAHVITREQYDELIDKVYNTVKDDLNITSKELDAIKAQCSANNDGINVIEPEVVFKINALLYCINKHIIALKTSAANDQQQQQQLVQQVQKFTTELNNMKELVDTLTNENMLLKKRQEATNEQHAEGANKHESMIVELKKEIKKLKDRVLEEQKANQCFKEASKCKEEDLITKNKELRSQIILQTELCAKISDLMFLLDVKDEQIKQMKKEQPIVTGKEQKTNEEESEKLDNNEVLSNSDIQAVVGEIPNPDAPGNNVKDLEKSLSKERAFSETLRKDKEVLFAKYRRTQEFLEKEKKLCEERLKEQRLELEGKLEKMKLKMKTLYTEEIAKMKAKQEREHGNTAKVVQQLESENEKYKEHAVSLSNQIVRLNDKMLEMQKQNTILSTKLKHLESKTKESSSTTSVLSSAASVGSSACFKRPSSIHVSTISVATAPPSVNVGTNLAMEDEEGELFNNTYLTDLKCGRMPDMTTEEIQYRNSLLPPHLKSAYAAQYDFGLQEEDIKDAPQNLDDSTRALLSSTNDGTGSSGSNGTTATRKKTYGGTSYKRPGPPTPSKHGGRLSFGGNSEPKREILKETYDGASSNIIGGGSGQTQIPTGKTAARFNLFSSRFSLGSGNSAPTNVAGSGANTAGACNINQSKDELKTNDIEYNNIKNKYYKNLNRRVHPRTRNLRTPYLQTKETIAALMKPFCTSTPRKSRDYYDKRRLIDYYNCISSGTSTDDQKLQQKQEQVQQQQQQQSEGKTITTTPSISNYKKTKNVLQSSTHSCRPKKSLILQRLRHISPSSSSSASSKKRSPQMRRILQNYARGGGGGGEILIKSRNSSANGKVTSNANSIPPTRLSTRKLSQYQRCHSPTSSSLKKRKGLAKRLSLHFQGKLFSYCGRSRGRSNHEALYEKKRKNLQTKRCNDFDQNRGLDNLDSDDDDDNDNSDGSLKNKAFLDETDFDNATFDIKNNNYKYVNQNKPNSTTEAETTDNETSQVEDLGNGTVVIAKHYQDPNTFSPSMQSMPSSIALDNQSSLVLAKTFDVVSSPVLSHDRADILLSSASTSSSTDSSSDSMDNSQSNLKHIKEFENMICLSLYGRIYNGKKWWRPRRCYRNIFTQRNKKNEKHDDDNDDDGNDTCDDHEDIDFEELCKNTVSNAPFDLQPINYDDDYDDDGIDVDKLNANVIGTDAEEKDDDNGNNDNDTQINSSFIENKNYHDTMLTNTSELSAINHLGGFGHTFFSNYNVTMSTTATTAVSAATKTTFLSSGHSFSNSSRSITSMTIYPQSHSVDHRLPNISTLPVSEKKHFDSIHEQEQQEQQQKGLNASLSKCIVQASPSNSVFYLAMGILLILIIYWWLKF